LEYSGSNTFVAVKLRRMTDRIQACAIQPCGELLNEIKPQASKRTDIDT